MHIKTKTAYGVLDSYFPQTFGSSFTRRSKISKVLLLIRHTLLRNQSINFASASAKDASSAEPLIISVFTRFGIEFGSAKFLSNFRAVFFHLSASKIVVVNQISANKKRMERKPSCPSYGHEPEP